MSKVFQKHSSTLDILNYISKDTKDIVFSVQDYFQQ